MKATLKNTQTGETKVVKVGFSWTTFFFGFWPAIFRGDWLWAVILFVLCWLTVGIAGIIMAFVYNQIYIKRLVEQGFRPADEESKQALASKNILVDLA